MSIELETMFNNFIDNKIPQLWEEVGYPSLKPLASWFDDMVLRVKFIAEWLYKGPPKTYWLSAFFFPQGFMTASLQSYARATATPIDTIKFRTNILTIFSEGVEEAPETGVNMHGMYLQGADWNLNQRKITESKPKELFVIMPVVWLEPIDVNTKVDDKPFDCPLYKTSLRAGELSTTGHSTNFVLYLSLSSSQKAEYWVNRGAALLCQLDD